MENPFRPSAQTPGPRWVPSAVAMPGSVCLTSRSRSPALSPLPAMDRLSKPLPTHCSQAASRPHTCSLQNAPQHTAGDLQRVASPLSSRLLSSASIVGGCRTGPAVPSRAASSDATMRRQYGSTSCSGTAPAFGGMGDLVTFRPSCPSCPPPEIHNAKSDCSFPDACTRLARRQLSPIDAAGPLTFPRGRVAYPDIASLEKRLRTEFQEAVTQVTHLVTEVRAELEEAAANTVRPIEELCKKTKEQLDEIRADQHAFFLREKSLREAVQNRFDDCSQDIVSTAHKATELVESHTKEIKDLKQQQRSLLQSLLQLDADSQRLIRLDAAAYGADAPQTWLEFQRALLLHVADCRSELLASAAEASRAGRVRLNEVEVSLRREFLEERAARLEHFESLSKGQVEQIEHAVTRATVRAGFMSAAGTGECDVDSLAGAEKLCSYPQSSATKAGTGESAVCLMSASTLRTEMEQEATMVALEDATKQEADLDMFEPFPCLDQDAQASLVQKLREVEA